MYVHVEFRQDALAGLAIASRRGEGAAMDHLAQDVRLAFRQLLKQRSFSAIVVVTLGLAVGVNALMFSFVNFFVLRPLPFGDVSRTMMIFAKHPERGRDRMGASYADFVEWRRDNTTFEDLGAWQRRTYNLTGSGDARRVQGALATASLFVLWNLGPVHGRVLRPEDDKPGAVPVALLSHGFWERQFGGDPGVVGRTIRLDGIPHEVVGVLTPAIEIGSLSEIEVWTALSPVADPADREGRTLRITGRLKQGVTMVTAAAEIRGLAERQERDHPATNARWTATVLPVRRAMTGANTWTVLALLAVAVALVLAIACANVANLVLARGAVRARETAVRAALGASRWRLVRQFLTEGTVLAVLGGSLGVLLASAGLDLIRSVTFEPFFKLVTVDRRVMIFSAVIALLTPLVFGLLPALSATARDLVSTLKDSTGGSVSAAPGRLRGRSLLVVGQLAVALSLLLVAGLAVRTALAVQKLDIGFDSRDLLTLKVELPAARYASDEQVRAFYGQLESRLAALPGVVSVAVAAARPVLEAVPTEALALEGQESSSKEAAPWAARTTVSRRYFETLRVPIVEGRAFDENDVPGSEPAVVVSQAFASRYLPDESPLGRRVRLGPEGSPWRTIVGVAADVMNAEIGEPPRPQAYVPFEQQPTRTLTLLVRTDLLDPTIAAARREVAQLDPEQPLYDVKTMERAFFEDLAGDRVITGLFIVFAGVALGLAAVGLYGLISFTVSQRTREIGVRVALGADRRQILGMVLGQGLRIAGFGLALGLLLGLGLSRVMASVLVGVSATDPLTFTVVPLVLGLVAVAAIAIPARRAARYDPAAVLRAE
jgi:putative ABC transport system permease protein